MRSAPALAGRLINLIAELRGEGEPDVLDELRRRREARLLALGLPRSPVKGGRR